MRRFRFPLEKVLRLRVHAERVSRRDLAEELSSLGVLEAGMATVQESLATCREQDGVARAGSLARALEIGMLATAARIARAMETATARVVKAREIYHETRRDARAIQDLREQRFEAWREEALASEQAEFDEVARIRFAARRRALTEGLQ